MPDHRLGSRRSRPRGPRHMGEVVARFRAGVAPPTLLARVQQSWAEAVGTRIAEQASPATEHDGVVRVHCRSAVWAAELTMLSEQLVVEVNDVLSGGRPLKALKFIVASG